MTTKAQPIAHYSTAAGAQRYKNDLERVWPGREFVVVCHPYDFGYTVANKPAPQPNQRLAYVSKRPRGFGQRHPAG